MARKKICVIAEDIANGKPQVAAFCPIALAIKRGLNVSKALVISNEWWIEREGKQWHRLPVRAGLFVSRFDDGVTVEPFNFFLLDVPDAS